MITGDHDKLKHLAGFNLCAEHNTPLVVTWHSEAKAWVLRCGHNHYPDTIVRQPSFTEMFKQGEELHPAIADNVEKRIRRRAMTQDKAITEYKFEGVPNKDLATGELLDPRQVKALMDYAVKYNLDPFRGHVVLMYSKPYITLDGYLFHANRTRKAYSLQSRPMTTEEIRANHIGETDHAWVAECHLLDTGSVFTGLGIVTYEEMTAKSPRDATKLRSPVVAAHPWQLAQKRAEWQALRRGFPIGETEPENREGVNKHD